MENFIGLVSKNNINDLVRLHQESLPDDILPSLGSGFLSRYYKIVFETEGQYILGAFQGVSLVGFCQLSVKPLSIFTILKNHPLFILNIFLLVFKNPKIFISGILAVLHRAKFNSKFPEISFIAVNKKFQGKGIGSELIKAVTSHKKVLDGHLMTKTSNPVAKKIYEKQYDAKVAYEFQVFGKKYWYLIWKKTL